MEITGKFHYIGETTQVTPTFSKREFALEAADNPMYPQFIGMQASQSNCALLDGYKKGDEVTVSFNLRGREWTSPTGEVKFFNTLDVWRIARIGNVAPVTVSAESRDEDPAVPF